MLSPNDKKLEKLDLFYRPSVAKPKTSAEIISEARNALRTIRTQRPFTPREDQRKLFGPASSRTPENRPPSSFSLHASSFEPSDPRPISRARLSPLDLKTKALASPTTKKDPCLPFPKPPVDPVKIRRVSSARARFFRAASQGTHLPDRMLPPTERKKTVESIERVMMGTSMVKISGTHLTESNAIGRLKNHPLQLTYDGGFSEIKEQEMFKEATSLPSYLRSRGDQGKRSSRASSCPNSSDLSRMETKAVSKDDLQDTNTETEVGDIFWNTRIVPILHELEKEENIEMVCAACTQLHHALEEGNMLGNKFKRRNILLKTLYKLVDVGSDPLSLKLAKIILALKVSRKNLLNVCKLIFKISRNEKNDSLIQNDSILESLLEVLRSEDLQTNTEAFLYCVGAIKFLSGNPGFLNEMISKDAVEILMNLIKQINENTKKCGTCFPNSGHLLVQVTATLRNLVDSPLARRKLLSISALPQLCTVMGQYLDDTDVCTNIARMFSKLTSYHDCCVALASYSRCYALFLNLINKYQKKQDLVVRIVFILGNLTAKNNQAREQFFKEKGSIPTLLALFRTFYKLDLHPERREGEGGEQPKAPTPPAQVEDVLIKLTRVLANLAIHPGVGQAMAANPHVVGLLLTTLEYKSVDDCEELVINTTATVNNLSYYQVKDSVIQDKRLHIAELLLKLLVSNNMDGILEAVRVFGNLSQDRDVCDFIVQKNIHKFMIALLDAKHQDICFSACGVLLNLTVDKDKRAILKEGGGIKKLVDCLKDFGPTDWQLACLVCKTLWNFSENITNASSCFGDEDTNTLLVLLPSFLDEELALDGSFDQDLKNYHKLHWETEFKPVAQQLLNRIQSHHTFLEPLPIPAF
ncbi:armadillo repeat containing 2 [Rhinolophus ferrumequinum]|uniref:Armadillo repeat containing 2 n=1 Tax=Rhinolophus ferrumequinum TaxID=59479 RepID=A0A671EUL6_RHIFE|nr:armadillo repeat-containing protein 2 [Rhinolophus ferrumequinum]XP_032953684.1 armadillo repeat-containing protein 2 [Rhinolophus ferrumequinum]XP_032953695.1 armadillo repeat-containing protein 2 [Rhinolophus ferrumequinum]XP_032953703.1 armadillo repeat-containing protein 2 [Rhinolophus ferrumequinum]XP_032953712.1 armadillo repeat-containing protein 2 [Rhinolophus ferrumequinum]KAF6364058.1 armadillo repeat containing 2 [Rhinolophus ferrumequinum]